jgi:hypothetical protein
MKMASEDWIFIETIPKTGDQKRKKQVAALHREGPVNIR